MVAEPVEDAAAEDGPRQCQRGPRGQHRPAEAVREPAQPGEQCNLPYPPVAAAGPRAARALPDMQASGGAVAYRPTGYLLIRPSSPESAPRALPVGSTSQRRHFAASVGPSSERPSSTRTCERRRQFPWPPSPPRRKSVTIAGWARGVHRVRQSRFRLGVDMRVLVTGHEGYLGSVLVPLLAQAGHEVVGLDTGLFADCMLGPAPAGCRRCAWTCATSTAEHLADGRPDAVMHLAALCNDPLGDLNPELTYDVNHLVDRPPGRRPPRPPGVTRFLFSSSCSLYGAGTDDAPLDETAGFAPLTPYGESKILLRAGPGAARRRRLLPGVPAQRHRVRVLPAAARRPGRQRPGRARAAHRRGPAAQRRHGLAPAGARRGHRRARSSRCWRRRASGCTPGRTTSADAAENYLIRDVAELVHEVVGGTVTFADGRRRGRAQLPRLLRPDRPRGAGVPAAVDGAQGRRAARRGLPAVRAQLDDLMGERHQRLKRINALSKAGRIDAALRWTGASDAAD